MSETVRKVRALDPPMCKICGVRHWFKDPHVFGRGPATKAKALDVAKKAVAAPPPSKKAKSKKKARR